MFNFFGGDGFPGGHGHMGGGGDDEEVDTEGLYKTLGVAKQATPNEIKKAYRKMAMKLHPDKPTGDEAKFKEVSKAYEILSNQEKRDLYDKYGEKGVEQGGPGGMDAGDIFSSFFGGGGGGGRRGPRKGKDVLFKLKVTLAELYQGATKKLRLTKQVICQPCEGKGGKGARTCTTCKGRGVRMVIRQLGPGMIQQMQMQCDTCDGQGTVIPPGARCSNCDGNKTVKVKKTLEVHVEKGMRHGQKKNLSR
jgi:DnaJ family protein A protein 2